MIWNWTWSTDFSIIAIIGWIIPIVMLFFIPVNRKPSSATAWLMLILLLPYLGLIIFLLIGSPKLSRHRRAQQRTMDGLISKAVADAEQQPELTALLDPTIPLRYEPFVKLNTNLGYLPAFGGNSVELLPDYHDVFQRIRLAPDWVFYICSVVGLFATGFGVYVTFTNPWTGLMTINQWDLWIGGIGVLSLLIGAALFFVGQATIRSNVSDEEVIAQVTGGDTAGKIIS